MFGYFAQCEVLRSDGQSSNRRATASREYVLVDEVRRLAIGVIPVFRHCYSLNDSKPLRSETTINRVEKGGEVVVADCFYHFDRHNAAVHTLHVTIVANFEFDLLFHSFFFDALHRVIVLLLRYGDGCHFAPCLSRAVYGEVTPSSSNFEHGVALVYPCLCNDGIHLCILCFIQAGCRRSKQSGRVYRCVAEEGREKGGGQVVVCCDILSRIFDRIGVEKVVRHAVHFRSDSAHYCIHE
mmetsp:Transcript_30752/g.80439  ORF Transcript_30752/g.80439 Transcript_30752/m.80439 type:complete len:239 (-) Transcript_30752:699-1415(-)